MALLFYINVQHLFTELKEHLGSGSANCVQDREIGGRGTRGDVTTRVGGLGATRARVTLSFVTVASVRATTAGLCLEPGSWQSRWHGHMVSMHTPASFREAVGEQNGKGSSGRWQLRKRLPQWAEGQPAW